MRRLSILSLILVTVLAGPQRDGGQTAGEEPGALLQQQLPSVPVDLAEGVAAVVAIRPRGVVVVEDFGQELPAPTGPLLSTADW